MKLEQLKNRQAQIDVKAAAAVVMGIFVVATMGFSSAAIRLSQMQPAQIFESGERDLLANRAVFVGVDTSFAAYQNAIQQQ